MLTVFRADFADDEQIQELIAWQHPHTGQSDDEITYTEEENLVMLRLPRKECQYIHACEKDTFIRLTLS